MSHFIVTNPIHFAVDETIVARHFGLTDAIVGFDKRLPDGTLVPILGHMTDIEPEDKSTKLPMWKFEGVQMWRAFEMPWKTYRGQGEPPTPAAELRLLAAPVQSRLIKVELLKHGLSISDLTQDETIALLDFVAKLEKAR